VVTELRSVRMHFKDLAAATNTANAGI